MKAPDWKIWIKDRKECKKWLESYRKNKMLKQSIDDSRLYMKKAEHNLNFANWIKEQHKAGIKEFFGSETFYDWAVNIYYYSIYHSALALISREGFESKNHSATLCFLIYYHFHVDKDINQDEIHLIASSLEIGDIESLGYSKEIRERASYNVHEVFEEKLASQMQEQAVDFINKIRNLLKL